MSRFLWFTVYMSISLTAHFFKLLSLCNFKFEDYFRCWRSVWIFCKTSSQ